MFHEQKRGRLKGKEGGIAQDEAGVDPQNKDPYNCSHSKILNQGK